MAACIGFRRDNSDRRQGSATTSRKTYFLQKANERIFTVVTASHRAAAGWQVFRRSVIFRACEKRTIDRWRDYRTQHAAVKVTTDRRIVSLKGISCHRRQFSRDLRLLFCPRRLAVFAKKHYGLGDTRMKSGRICLRGDSHSNKHI
jgi:hypothetical protein